MNKTELYVGGFGEKAQISLKLRDHISQATCIAVSGIMKWTRILWLSAIKRYLWVKFKNSLILQYTNKQSYMANTFIYFLQLVAFSSDQVCFTLFRSVECILSCQMTSGFLTRVAFLRKWMPLCSDVKIFLRYCNCYKLVLIFCLDHSWCII